MLPLLLTMGVCTVRGDDLLVPQIDGDWWTVAGDPDLGEFTDPRQQPVDFAIWQAADGTWQLWSCIRGTKCGGNTRLLYAWEGRHLTDSGWEPRGIAMQADPQFGETAGGLQAPHVVRIGGLYHMLYGDWEHICRAVSTDGKRFERVLTDEGKTGMFGEGAGANARDAMLVCTRERCYCYYTAHPYRTGAVYCRTSKDLAHWSEPHTVAMGGHTGTGFTSAECPHVVRYRHRGWFYLFRTQRYGRNAITSVYRSGDPLDFGVNDDRYLVQRLPVGAPEIIRHEGDWYIACLLPSLKGIRIARLKWAPPPVRGVGLFDLDDPAQRAAWRVTEGEADPVFTASDRDTFAPPYRHFIGTAEGADGGPVDDRQCVVESPAFSITKPQYWVSVSGGSDQGRAYVALVSAGTGEELLRLTGRDDNTLEDVPVDTSEHIGEQAVVRVVDRATGPWGHINFGGVFPPVPADAAEMHEGRLREFLWEKCGMPSTRLGTARPQGTVLADPHATGVSGTVPNGSDLLAVSKGYSVRKLVYEAEPGSSVPADLYLPRPRKGRVPAIIIAYGHGGSKSAYSSQYAGQLYAKLGFAVLAADPLGEEERDPDGRLGTRTHDVISEEAQALGRPVVGKMVWDLMRGIDVLQARPEVDPERIYVVGSSLGAIVGMYLAALDSRVKGAVLSAMYFAPPANEKFCTRGMGQLIAERLDYPHLLSLAAPRCQVLIVVGDDDAICGGRPIYESVFGRFVRQTRTRFALAGAPDGLQTRVFANAGHRPYYLTREAALWLSSRAGLPPRRLEMIREWPDIHMGDWAEANGVEFEKLYGTEEHFKGLMAVDAGVRYRKPQELACLTEEKRRGPEFTAEGWLERVRSAHRKEGDG
jgi:dienelactone hydrolase